MKVTTETTLGAYLKDLLQKKRIRLVKSVGTYRGEEETLPTPEDLEEVAADLCIAYMDHLQREESR